MLQEMRSTCDDLTPLIFLVDWLHCVVCTVSYGQVLNMGLYDLPIALSIYRYFSHKEREQVPKKEGESPISLCSAGDVRFRETGQNLTITRSIFVCLRAGLVGWIILSFFYLLVFFVSLFALSWLLTGGSSRSARKRCT